MKQTALFIYSVHFLQPGRRIEYKTEQRLGFFKSDLQIYCYAGTQKCLSHIFQSINLEVDIDNDDFVQYEGCNPDEVQSQYDNQRSIFSYNFFGTNKKKLIKLNPFNQTCVGIDSAHTYSVQLNLVRIDFWKIILLVTGLCMFLASSSLSETPVFYYLSGILLGIFASFLVVVYFVSKLFPKVRLHI